MSVIVRLALLRTSRPQQKLGHYNIAAAGIDPIWVYIKAVIHVVCDEAVRGCTSNVNSPLWYDDNARELYPDDDAQ